MPASAWEKNSDFLRRRVATITASDVAVWSPRQVAHFVATIPGVRILNGDEVFHRIIEEEIDGEAFLLLTQTDLVKMLGLKLGLVSIVSGDGEPLLVAGLLVADQLRVLVWNVEVHANGKKRVPLSG